MVAREDRRPASRQVADELAARIERGEYSPGSSLPTYRQLATEFGVAVNTALAAIRLLRDQGLVTIRKNAGARVRDQSSDIDVAAELRTIRDQMSALRTDISKTGSQLSDLEDRLTTLVDEVGATD